MRSTHLRNRASKYDLPMVTVAMVGERAHVPGKVRLTICFRVMYQDEQRSGVESDFLWGRPKLPALALRAAGKALPQIAALRLSPKTRMSPSGVTARFRSPKCFLASNGFGGDVEDHCCTARVSSVARV